MWERPSELRKALIFLQIHFHPAFDLAQEAGEGILAGL
jgi:hypothetical protein